MTTIDDIRERLAEIRPPGFPRDIVALGMVQGIDAHDGSVTIHLKPPAMPPSSLNATIADIRRGVGALDGVKDVTVRVPQASGATGAAAFNEIGPLPGVRDIIAVASAKGGVGKSTVATNLALALRQRGQRVGLLDCDVYGPSLPIMLGLQGRPRAADNQRIFPLEKYGLRVMSMGFFLDDTSPVIWRGPLVTGLLRQFLKDVQWGALDVLVVDMPPGTGDAALTMVQQVPLSGGLVVTTPQEVSVIDVERGIAMFNQVNTPVLGLVENMSVYICPHCGTRDELFGSGGAERLARQFHVPVLGQIPIVPAIRESGDAGTPLVIGQPDHPASRIYVSIAEQVLDRIAAERAPAPRIVG